MEFNYPHKILKQAKKETGPQQCERRNRIEERTHVFALQRFPCFGAKVCEARWYFTEQSRYFRFLPVFFGNFLKILKLK